MVLDSDSLPVTERLSVQDMVKSNGKNKSPFGIEGYNLPIQQHPYFTPKYSVPKLKGVNFVDIMTGVTKHNPGPGTHDVKMQWIKPGPKAAKGGKRNTYIDQIVEYEKKFQFPSSHQVSILLKFRSTIRRKLRGKYQLVQSAKQKASISCLMLLLLHLKPNRLRIKIATLM